LYLSSAVNSDNSTFLHCTSIYSYLTRASSTLPSAVSVHSVNCSSKASFLLTRSNFFCSANLSLSSLFLLASFLILANLPYHSILKLILRPLKLEIINLCLYNKGVKNDALVIFQLKYLSL